MSKKAVFGDRWHNRGEIGNGGQAQVFRVADRENEFEGPLALKLLSRLERARRFEREIDVMRGLDHRGVMRVLATGVHKGHAFYVMPYYERGSLEGGETRKLWYERPAKALHFFATICDAVAAAHEEQIVHRDIKPSNILLTPAGDPIVSDFGLCFVNAEDRLTEDWRVVGSRWFMAPELEHGRADDVTPRADVYSLGKVLYWLVTGGGFFSREDLYFQENLELTFHNDRYKHVTQLLRRSIAYSPGSRFAHAGEFASEARRIALLFEAKEPTQLVMVSGDNQTAHCRGGFQQRLVVRLEDEEGRPVADRDVWWYGDGQLEPPRSTTDVDGAVSAFWAPLGKAGTATARAIFGALGPAVFHGHVLPGPLIRYSVEGLPQGEAIPGSVHEIVLRGFDQCGNIVPLLGPPHWTIMMDPQGRGIPTGLSLQPIDKSGIEPGAQAYLLTVGPVDGQSAYIPIGLDKSSQFVIRVHEPEGLGSPPWAPPPGRPPA